MTINKICNFFAKEDNFIITTHEAPDGDAIGAEIVLYTILKHLKKKVLVLNSDTTEQKYDYLNPGAIIKKLAPDEKFPVNSKDYNLIIVDTAPDNIGHLKTRLNAETVKNLLVIDHHDYEEKIPFDGLFLPDYSSTCEMLYEVQQFFKVPFSPSLTEAMFTGIVYDTGSFIYPKTSARTFLIAHQLVVNGARPNFTYSSLYESKSIESLKLRAMVGSTLEFHFNNHLAYQYMSHETLLKSGAHYEESQEIVNIPLQCNDVRVSVFIKCNNNGRCRCSIRTKPELNCLPLVTRFNGGGHPTAAGFKLTQPVDEIKDAILAFFENKFT